MVYPFLSLSKHSFSIFFSKKQEIGLEEFIKLLNFPWCETFLLSFFYLKVARSVNIFCDYCSVDWMVTRLITHYNKKVEKKIEAWNGVQIVVRKKVFFYFIMKLKAKSFILECDPIQERLLNKSKPRQTERECISLWCFIFDQKNRHFTEFCLCFHDCQCTVRIIKTMCQKVE